MNLVVKMAWLNIWRNKPRTILLLASMTVGLTGVLLMMGLIRGWVDSMRDAALNTFAGHVKIMAVGFFENPSVDRTFINDLQLNHPRIKHQAPRLALQGMLSTPRHARIVQLVGIDPEAEAEVSIIQQSLIEGDFLQSDSEDLALVGKQLAKRTGLKVGKKVVLTGAQRGGEIGAHAVRICGIYDTGQTGFDERHVYLPLADANRLFNLTNAVSEIVLVSDDKETSSVLASELAHQLDRPDLVFLDWRERLPLVTESMRYVDQTMFIYYLIFFGAMAFGIINTLLMSIGERTREIGMMMAVGMRRRRVVGMILVESIFISLLAVVCGSILGFLILSYYEAKGIDMTGLAAGAELMQMGRMLYPTRLPGDFITGAWITLAITLFFSLYPAWRASRLLPVVALRQT